MSRSSGKGKAVAKSGLKDQKRKDSTPTNDFSDVPNGKGHQPMHGQGKKEQLKEQAQSWSWKLLTDSILTNHPAVFSKDSKYFFLPSATTVKIYSTTTGQVVSTLSATNLASASASSSASTSTSTAFDGHTNTITSVALNPHNPYQLYTASLDGCIKIWDYLEPRLLKTINLKNPIVHICVHENFMDALFVAVNIPEKDKDMERRHPVSHVLRVSWGQSSSHVEPAHVSDDNNQPKRRKREYSTLRIGKTATVMGLGISASGNWLVALSGFKTLIANTSSLQAGFSKLTSTDQLTCLAFHPTEEYFATGDSRGQIRLWYSLQNPEELSFEKLGVEKKATTTLFHWHAHPVQSLSFTPNGSYLLSGGEESTMVIWQLDSGHKEFVPRLGAPIRSLSSHRSQQRGEEYLIGLLDGTLVTISAQTLKVSWTSSRMKINSEMSDSSASSSSLPPVLAVHPQTRHILLPSSHPSTLQIYSTQSSSVISEIEIAPSNRISSRSKHISTITPTRISQAILSPSDGHWLATVDYREDDEFGLEVGLKMWKWDETEKIFMLNTRIDRPHGRCMVNTVEFNVPDGNSEILLATGGQDGNVKTWVLKTVKATKKTEGEAFWVQRTSFAYRNEIPRKLAFSLDSSLLAVAQGPFITLWDVATNLLVKVLTTMKTRSISSFTFLGDAGRYMAISGNDEVVLWDLVSGKVVWNVQLQDPISHLSPLPKSDMFSVFLTPQLPTNGTRVLVFSPQQRTPVKEWTLPFQLHKIASYFSLFPKGFTMVGITKDWSLAMFGDEVRSYGSIEEGAMGRSIKGRTEERPMTLFEDIFGRSAFAYLDDRPPRVAMLENAGSVEGVVDKGLLDGPSYLLPPMHTLYQSLMEGLLGYLDEHQEVKDTNTGDEGEDTKAGNVDVEMEDAEASTRTLRRPTRLPERTIDDKELDLFVDLFSQHAIIGSSSKSPSNAVFNPKPSFTNGYSSPATNGILKTRNTTSNGTLSSNLSTEKSALSSPVVVKSFPTQKVGGKRKTIA